VIRRYSDVGNLPGLASGLDAVFFQSSNVKSFADDASRAQFRERWLGRYLSHDPQWAYVALDANDQVIGYLVGSLSDPALTARFSDIPYFAGFYALTASFPAHLHVNLAERARGQGIGSQLIERFAHDAAQAGTPGVHVVTGRGARNAGFYNRNGFKQLGSWGEGPREVVFLGRVLQPA
jgi:GNAT superfamily N-acetyltransferase